MELYGQAPGPSRDTEIEPQLYGHAAKTAKSDDAWTVIVVLLILLNSLVFDRAVHF